MTGGAMVRLPVPFFNERKRLLQKAVDATRTTVPIDSTASVNGYDEAGRGISPTRRRDYSNP